MASHMRLHVPLCLVGGRWIMHMRVHEAICAHKYGSNNTLEGCGQQPDQSKPVQRPSDQHLILPYWLVGVFKSHVSEQSQYVAVRPHLVDRERNREREKEREREGERERRRHANTGKRNCRIYVVSALALYRETNRTNRTCAAPS
jgi:hypothetical protein